MSAGKSMIILKNANLKSDGEIKGMRRRIPGRTERFGSGATMVEIILAMALNSIIVLAVGVLLIGGNRGWQNIYNSANKQIRQDALAATVAFGSVGRKSNRLSYQIYSVNEGAFLPAESEPFSSEEIVSGDAVEFRYWDVALDESDTYNLIDSKKPATAYALFYIEDEKLKVDYGPYPPGAVSDEGGYRNTAGVVTQVLAENVSTEPDSDTGPFSHTTISGVGQGSVRLNIILTDPDTGETTKIMTSTLMRNIWPR